MRKSVTFPQIWITLAGILFFLLGCSKSQLIGGSLSPDGRLEVGVFYNTIRGNPAHDGQVSIALTRNGRAETIYSDPKDRNPRFLEIAWSSDSRVFGVWEIDGLTTPMLFGYDIIENRQVRETVTTKLIHESLIKRFNLSERAKDPGFDPLHWVREALFKGDIPKLWPGTSK